METNKIDKSIIKILKLFHIKANKKIEKLIIQIIKFIIVGGTAFILDFLFLYLFKEIFDLSILVSNTLSFCISVIYNYIASTKWVFDLKKERSKEKNFIIFIIFSILGLIINDTIMLIMNDKIKIHYLISKIMATILVMIFNFITRKKFLEK
ncbi:MAG: GtrA family protein [Bacilli bacterium]|nr:GtrA family protein [Bacilli bacterium]